MSSDTKSLREQRELVAAIKRQEMLNLKLAFDPFVPDSRPNPKQLEILRDIGKIKYRYCVAGNQCKPAYSLVKMADGTSKPIVDIKVGDWVAGFDKKTRKTVPVQVVKFWDNGERDVYRYHTSPHQYTDSTDNHRMLRISKDGTFVKDQIKNCDELITIEEGGSSYLGRKVTETRLLGKMPVYDITVDHPDHLYICDDYITSNSGKSSLSARELAWLLNRDHPYLNVDAMQGNEPLLCLVVGQNLTMVATELWNKKVLPFLTASDWRHEKQGNTLKLAKNVKTGDQVVFLSHTDGSDKNRKNMQGYVANYVWLDEMPANADILDELQLRIQSKGAQGRVSAFLSTFTPKFRNDKIRKIIDLSDGKYSKKYRMSKFDNPLFAHSKEEELARLAGFSESERNTILYGEWSTGDQNVYHFDYDKMTVDKLPEHYNRGWRHVESVDPALRSKAGYTLWAEDPADGTWYLINDQYIEGHESLDSDTLFMMVQARSNGYNIVRRISDSMAYYTSAAAKRGVSYQIPYSKNNRKEELIKGLQSGLSHGKIKIPRHCGTFIDEIQGCQFKDDTDKLVNSSSYHTLDCAQYFCDAIPKYDPTAAPMPREAMMLMKHQGRIATAQKMSNFNNQGRAKIGITRRRGQSGKYRIR